MTNYPFQRIEDFDDIEVKNGYKANVLTGKITAADYIADLRKTSRDNARTPMQWDATTNAGFTTGTKPWLAVNPNYTQINAKEELSDPNSVYHYYQKMIALRSKSPALIYGDYKDLDPTSPNIFAYTRTLGEEKYLVVLNFSAAPTTYTIPDGQKAGTLNISNLGSTEQQTTTLNLKAWEARVYKQ
jgi:oligo-1,6-glucosidase